MSWRDELLPASFRGVPFFVESAELGAGRRAIHHEIPFSEDPPFSQDLGARTKTYPIEGYVIGDDYFTLRDNLLKALNTRAPGELVHPYHGTKRIQVGAVRVRHEAREGGLCRFTIEFTETSAPLELPTSTIDAPVALAAKVDGARSAVQLQFTATRQIQSILNGVDMAVSEVRALSASFNAAREVLRSLPISGTTRAEFERLMETPPAGTFTTFSEYLFALVDGVFSHVAAALDSVTAPINRAAAFLRIAAADPGVRPVGTSPARVQERENFDATSRLMQRLPVIYAAVSVGAQTFASYEDAVAAREAVTDALDDLVEGVTDDTFSALQDLRGTLAQAVPGAESDLARLVNFTPHATLPSLVLAHTLYGDLDREQDILDRNRIPNPGFVTGGATLQVLTDD